MPTFPALDEEPPPRSPWLVAVRVAGVVVVLAAVSALLVLRPWHLAGTVLGAGAPQAGASSTVEHPDLLGASGRVLVLDYHTGQLGYTALDGTGYKALPGASVAGVVAAVSPDGTWVTSDTRLVRLTGHHAVLTSPIPPTEGNALTTTSYPWADHGRRLTLITEGGGHADVSTVDLGGHDQHSLGGGATDAVGDPTRDGALVMVAGRTSVNTGLYSELPTIRLELRTPGHAHLLETTTGLATEGGLPTRLDNGKHHPLPYRVAATFSPDGQQIAVTLDQLSRTPSAAHGLVVLTRGGTPEFATTAKTSVWASWSHDGSRLAFQPRPGRVVVLDLGNRDAAPQQFDVGRAQVAPCLWSAGDGDLLCDDYRAGHRYLLQLSTTKVAGPIPLKPTDRYAVDWQGGAA